MIQKLQKIFHTDKWWGRILLLSSFYLIFFILGYWIWFLLAIYKIINNNIFTYQIFPSVCFLFIIPILSFLIFFRINKIFNLKISNLLLIIINLLLIIINLLLFITASINNFVSPNFF